MPTPTFCLGVKSVEVGTAALVGRLESLMMADGEGKIVEAEPERALERPKYCGTGGGNEDTQTKETGVTVRVFVWVMVDLDLDLEVEEESGMIRPVTACETCFVGIWVTGTPLQNESTLLMVVSLSVVSLQF